MKIKKNGSAVWKGDIKTGKGEISTESGALKGQPYGFNTRFEDKAGTNPEELLGAAHAACFSMAFSKILGEAGFEAKKIETQSEISLEKKDSGFSITLAHLTVKAQIPEIDEAKFNELSKKAKEGCPVSRLFNSEITMQAQLDQS